MIIRVLFSALYAVFRVWGSKVSSSLLWLRREVVFVDEATKDRMAGDFGRLVGWDRRYR
jgi:hypothetical protein